MRKTIVFCILLMTTLPAFGSERFALLVGISEYHSKYVPRLEGPAHDVVAMKRGLTRIWKVPALNIVTLVNADATRRNIIEELNQLRSVSSPDDQVLIYISSHGTSSQDPEELSSIPDNTAVIVPYDAEFDSDGYLTNVLYSRTDIRPELENLETKGISVMVLLDACYSENAVRNNPNGSYRFVSSAIKDRKEKKSINQNNPTRNEYPFDDITMISAAASNQLALDIDYRVIERFPTIDGMPHGAFTDALLRVLTNPANGDINNDRILSRQEIHSWVSLFMGTRNYQQSPVTYPKWGEENRDFTFFSY